MNFERRGFIFKGIFDSNPDLHGKSIREMQVQPMENLASFIQEQQIDIAV